MIPIRLLFLGDAFNTTPVMMDLEAKVTTDI
jgi:hypothetical protein